MTRTPRPRPEPAADTYTMRETASVLGVSLGTVGNLRKNPQRNFPPEVPLGLRTKRFRKEHIHLYAKYGPLWDQAAPSGS